MSTSKYSNSLIFFVFFVLCSVGIGLTLYKNIVLGLPLFPGKRAQVWEVEAAVDFVADGGPVTVSLALPETMQRFLQVDEFFASPGYGFRKSDPDADSVTRAVWTKHYAEGKQYLYYKLRLHDLGEKTPKMSILNGGLTNQASNTENVDLSASEKKSAVGYEIFLPELTGAYLIAAQDILADVQQRSSDSSSFAALLIRQLNAAAASQSVRLLRGAIASQHSMSDLLIQLFQLVDIPTRLVKGVYLEDGRRKQQLVNMIEVKTEQGWVMFDLETGKPGVPNNFFLWQRGGVSLMDVRGGHNSQVNFSIISRSVPASDLIIAENKQRHEALMDFSLYSLPIEEQNAYKYILLVPIGTLIVVLMRILVGLKTSGTFMPVLMSLAFLQTKLLPGLIIFIIIVSIGLWIRFILNRLNLLLVARISAVVIVVIGIMAMLSILSYKLGIRQALSVTFFPMIILAWTIERMSILWEEEGPRHVFVAGGGSLLVATFSYFAMTNRYVEHLTFNFPELLLVILGITLLLGQYTGYRLFELRRFKPLI